MSLYRPPYLLLLFPLLIRFVFFSSSQNINYDVNLSPLRLPTPRNRSILILVVLDARSDRREYEFPLSTVECYAKRHNYTFRIVKDSSFFSICRQQDYMFRRHCVSSAVLEQSPSTDWLLFLDADIAVVNPGRLLEEYLDREAELIMYDRFAGWEIAMGSYFARNTLWTRDFLMKFADFETELPGSFHGTDNGAIHAFILRELQPSSLEAAQPCLRIWEISTGFDDLFLYEACIRSILGSKSRFGKLKIVPKGRGWVRDGWITQSKWSPQRDFMLHGYKASDRRVLSRIPFVNGLKELLSSRFMWYSFLKVDLTPECHWVYENELRVSDEAITQQLTRLHRQSVFLAGPLNLSTWPLIIRRNPSLFKCAFPTITLTHPLIRHISTCASPTESVPSRVAEYNPPQDSKQPLPLRVPLSGRDPVIMFQQVGCAANPRSGIFSVNRGWAGSTEIDLVFQMDEESVLGMLSNLTVEEQAIIRPVLERDLEFQRREKLRLQELRETVVERKQSLLSSKSQESFASSISTSVSPSSPSFRGCFTCGTKLGFLLHTGGKCRKCDQLICDSCKCYTSKDKSTWLCQLCFQDRELQAASGEWASSGEVVSEQLLTHLRKAAMERNRPTSAMGDVPVVRHPRMNRRFLTLPSLPVMSLLSVPTEAEATEVQRRDVTRRFWGGSPSPRSPSPRPVSAGSAGIVIVAPTPPPNCLMPGMHPREVIGSPSPRSAPPYIGSPMISKMLPLTEVEAPTPTSPAAPSPVAGIRRQAYGSTKSQTVYRGNHLLPIDPRERPQKLLRKTPRIVTGSDPLLLDEWIPYRCPSPSGSQSQASSQPNFVGEVCITCHYDPTRATLRLVVPQCRSLPHFGRHRPNPYVTIELSSETSSKTESLRKTSTRYGAVNPLFGESFQFSSLSKSSLEQRKLTISVWHRERLTKNSLIGEACLWLRDVSWHLGTGPIWLPLQSIDTPDDKRCSVLNLRLSFKLRDTERGIGALGITVVSIEPRLRHSLQIQVKLLLRDQRLSSRMGILSHLSSYTAEFPEVNIHDLHLRCAKIRLSKRTSFWKQCHLAEVQLNSWSHNVSRRTGCPCACPTCQPWHRLTEKPYKDQNFEVSVLLKKWPK